MVAPLPLARSRILPAMQAKFLVALATSQLQFRTLACAHFPQCKRRQQTLDSLRRRANARNISFRISLRWLIYIVNSVDKTKLSLSFRQLFLTLHIKQLTRFNLSAAKLFLNNFSSYLVQLGLSRPIYRRYFSTPLRTAT